MHIYESIIDPKMENLSRNGKKELFDKHFFDSDDPACGKYEAYSFKEYYLTFLPLSKIIKKNFHPRRVLDVGCAKGSFVYAFRMLGIEAYGIDVSEYAISCAPNALKPCLKVVDLNSDRLPFKDSFFDFVTFFGSIEYLQDHRHAIAELERVMANGGSLLLTTLYKRSKDDVYRTNIHNKAFWREEFSAHWTIPDSYYRFMSDYFARKNPEARSGLDPLKSLVFGKSKGIDSRLVFLWDTLTGLGILNYGVLLFTLHKSH